MPCESVRLPGGGRAIVCSRVRLRVCAGCGRKTADRLCDWKVATKQSGTCDAAICARCSHQPAPEKDLCPTHAAEWRARLAARGTAR
jgi:hypothetical protein